MTFCRKKSGCCRKARDSFPFCFSPPDSAVSRHIRKLRHTRSLFIRRPIHMPKKQTLPGSGQKGRPPWQAAVFRGGSWDILDFTVREGRAVYLQSGRTGGWENCRVFFYAGARPPAGADRRGRRRSGGGFGVGYLVGESFMKRKAESVRFQ